MSLDLLLRSEKGSALTHAEMDQNWTDIESFAAATDAQIAVSINPDGTLKDKGVEYAATLVGTDAYAITVAGTYSGLTDLAGRVLLVKIDVANTGPATLAVNGFSATAIYRPGGLALKSGDIKPGIAELTLYPGGSPYFVLLNPGTLAGSGSYSVTTNSTNDYTVTVNDLGAADFEVPAAYYAGYAVRVKINAVNTGAARIKISSTTPAIDLGFADIKKDSGTALTGGELQANQIYTLVHDGTNFQIASSVSAPVVLQVVEVSLASASSNAAATPVDTSIPQNTEGTEILTLSITPKSPSSKLYVEALVYLGNSGSNNKAVAAVHRDSAADAVAASFCNIDGVNTVYSLPVKAVESSVAQVATTFKLRVGSDSGTTFWNRASTGATLGGVMKTTLQITEVLT